MRKPLFKKISIIGVGLIGGSIGMAAKKRKLADLVVGVVHRKETVSQAFERRALDVATLDWKEGVRGADLVILCTPVASIVELLKKISPYLSPFALVIDVGSSKVSIEAAAKRYLKKGRFVGCHPMAGSEKRGVGHAAAGLFEDSVCFMTSANPKIEKFWKALGSRPVKIDAKAHDGWVAQASHLPHALAFSLFQKLTPPASFELNPSLKALARLAQSDPALWAGIFASNREESLRAIKDFEKSLGVFKRSLQSKNSAALVKFISHANRRAS